LRSSLLLLALAVVNCVAGDPDVNSDGYVDEFDVGFVARCVTMRREEDPRCLHADTNADGKIDARDMGVVLGHLGEVLFEPEWPAFQPASLLTSRDGVVHLHAPDRDRVYRWSLSSGRALSPISLGEDSRYLAYSPVTDRLYIAYGDGRITWIDAAFPDAELPLVQLAREPRGLATAGSIVFAVERGGSTGGPCHTYLPDGTPLASDGILYSSEYVWSAADRRLYFFRDAVTPNDLLWVAIDPETGELGGPGETPYNGSFDIAPPIRVSPDGSRVVLGSGDIYDGRTLQREDSFPFEPVDALWLAEGELLTLTPRRSDETLLRHWGRDLELKNLAAFPGDPLRVIGWGNQYAVLTLVEGRPTVWSYVPTDDADGDGVPNDADAFPLDPSAALDTDGDGFPDAWNPGAGPEDSADNLELDAFPFDSACHSPEQSLPDEPGVCDIASQIPDYEPESIVADSGGVLYLLSPENDRIYRWSTTSNEYLNPIDVDDDPRYLAWSGENSSLYVGYASGAITRIDLDRDYPGEMPFATTPGETIGLQTAGRFVFAADASAPRKTYYTFAEEGSTVSIEPFFDSSGEFTWSPANQRMYFIPEDVTPNTLTWVPIDTTTGEIGDEDLPSASQDHYLTKLPIRVSRDGARVVLGTGDVYQGISLEIAGALPIEFEDGLWLSDGSLVTIRQSTDGSTTLAQWDTDLGFRNVQRYPGAPLRVLETDGDVAVVTSLGGRPTFAQYVPGDDGDGDGVPSAEDAFPLDPAASVDTDGDGYPDRWNFGRGPEDSTQGLVLDAFPRDAACQLAQDGLPDQPDVCDIAGAIPVYVPARTVMDDAGIVYLLSPENDRIYRWSLVDAVPLNPIPVHDDPQLLAWSEENHRLYVGYATGSITAIDPRDAHPHESPFVTLNGVATGLQTAGSFVFTIDKNRDHGHTTYSAQGQRLSWAERSRTSRAITWSAANERMYLFRDGWFPNDLTWDAIDARTGALGGEGQTPYHGEYAIDPPIRVSPDGGLVLLGSGDYYDGLSLEIIGSLPQPITDAAFAGSGLLTIRPSGSGDALVELRSAPFTPFGPDFVVQETIEVQGDPLRVLSFEGRYYAITLLGGRPTFNPVQPTGDGDGDGVPNEEDAFPTDPAASVDSDGDGYPDAWNPGSGPADSTTGLAIDAFPADSACQLVAQDDGGVCDFANVIPDDPAKPLCDRDQRVPATDHGWIEVGPSQDMVPLCDGWILTGDTDENAVAAWNALDGRLGTFFPLSAAPGDLEVDPDAKRLYVALQGASAIAEIDLVTGDVVEVPILGLVDPELILGPGGGLFIQVIEDRQVEVYWLAPGAEAPTGGWSVVGGLVRYNRAYGELVVATPSYYLARYAFDQTSGPTLLQLSSTALPAGDLRVSPDGNHVAVTSYGNVVDLLGTDLDTVQGSWEGLLRPDALAFDRGGQRLLVAKTSFQATLWWFRVSDKVLLQTRGIPSCRYVNSVDQVGFSRGGGFAVVRQTCGDTGGTTRYHWYRAD
jgi:hypothetical protein